MSRYSFQTSKTISPSQAVEESKKKSSLLSDNSWIKRDEEEDEDIDRDPNFGRSVLSRYRTSETVGSSGSEEVKTTKTTSTSSSTVQALSKRFSGSNFDTSSGSTLPSSQSSSTYTRSTRTSMTEEPKTSTTTTTITKDGGKITETTITSTQSVRSPVIKSPTKTETFTERVMSSSKGTLYSNYSPTRTTKVTETVTTNKSAEDNLYDTLIPSSIKDGPSDSKKTISTTETVTVRSSPDSKAEDKLYDTLIPTSIKDEDSKTTVYSTERVTVKSGTNGDGIKTTNTRTSSSAEDDLYGTLLPKAITSNLSSPVRTSSITKSEIYTVESSRGGDSPTWTSSTDRYNSDDYSSSRKSSTYSRPDSSYEYTSITSPTNYTSTSYRSSSRSDDTDSVYTKSSMKNVYGSLDRPVLEKDLCSYCRKPFIGDAKMVLDDMKINCHANCFKCEVCNCSLGHLKAGDSMWIYKRMVHCDNCFEVTREKWRR